MGRGSDSYFLEPSKLRSWFLKVILKICWARFKHLFKVERKWPKTFEFFGLKLRIWVQKYVFWKFYFLDFFRPLRAFWNFLKIISGLRGKISKFCELICWFTLHRRKWTDCFVTAPHHFFIKKFQKNMELEKNKYLAFFIVKTAGHITYIKSDKPTD